VHGTSTRKVDDLVKALGVDSGISKSEVSRICAELDGEVGAFRSRSLAHIAFPYLFLDATYLKARVDSRVVSRAVVIATGVTGDGGREVLGLDVGDSEDGAFWTAFLRSLKARGRSQLATLPGSLPQKRPGPGAQRFGGNGGCGHPHDLRPADRR
jgi:putative transposase